MKKVLVINEKDLKDHEQIVICVADSVENAEKIINEYYGDFKEISYNGIRDSCLEYQKVIEVLDHENNPYRIEIWLEWFEINNIA